MNKPIATEQILKIGVADSDLQVVGEAGVATHGAQRSMWDQMAESRGLTRPGNGIGRLACYLDDAALLAQLGICDYRTSISWSRCLHSDGRPNLSGITWYRNFFKALRSHGVAIRATLYHWEMPAAVAESGGWCNPLSIELFSRYARVVCEALGDLVERFYVLNEPSCSALFGYHRGIHAPGETSLSRALQAAHNLLIAQSEVVRFLHRNGLSVSTVVNLQPAYAASSDPQDMEARLIASQYWNEWFLDPLFLGKYPEQILQLYEEMKVMPSGWQSDLSSIRVGSLLDSLGVNYYNGEVVRADTSTPLRFVRVKDPSLPANDLGWPIFVPPHYPEGLFDCLCETYSRYCHDGLRAFEITENGLAYAGTNGDPCNDEPRITFLQEHLRQLNAAIRSGIPVSHFFVWSFLDSYEWQDGYQSEARFGLVHVDCATLERRVKKSGWWLRDYLRGERI